VRRSIEMHACLVMLVALTSLATLGAARDFDEGQVWAYKTRPGEAGSTLLINKVENDPKLGRIYHISISKVQISAGPGVFTDQMPHLPVSKQTLEVSCVKLLGRSEPNPMYLPGYRMWREAFDAGRAGIYTISIAEILDLVEKMLQKQVTTPEQT
jgi:hypothetical protein